jgi:hypothetical protein
VEAVYIGKVSFCCCDVNVFHIAKMPPASLAFKIDVKIIYMPAEIRTSPRPAFHKFQQPTRYRNKKPKIPAQTTEYMSICG